MSRRGALWAAALLAILHLWLLAETLSLRVPLWHIDGAFQTASALFRLDQGQLPGRDFMPYLGIAAAYILFPFYKLAGGDLAATTTAAFFVVFVFAVTGMATLTKLVFPRASFPAATAVAVLIVLLLLPIVLSERLPIKAADLLGWPLQPGHSLRPVRAFAPVLTALAIFLVARERPLGNRQFAWLGLIGGSVLCWSNDYGPPSAMIAALFALYALIRDGWTWGRVLAAGSAALLAAVSVLMIATGGHAVPFLDYMLNGVGGDQWWYYSGFEPKDRIFRIADVARVLSVTLILALIVLIYAVARAIRTPRPPHVLVALIGFALLCGGLLASIGGHIDAGYFNAFKWWALVAALLFVAEAAMPRLAGRRPDSLTVSGPKWLLITCAFLPVMAWINYVRDRGELASDPAVFYQADLGGFVPKQWQAYLARARSSRVEAIEEYWGLWSAVRRTSPNYVDSTIHALGPERDRFAQRLEAWPGLVITSRPIITAGYQGWSVAANWWFYRRLLSGFRAELASPTTLLWSRAPRPAWRSVPCRVEPGGKALLISAAGPGLYDLTVDHAGLPGGRTLLLVQTGLRSPQTGGWVSVDPAARQARLPILIEDNVPIRRVRFRLLPEGTEGLRLNRCSSGFMAMDPSVRAILPSIRKGGKYAREWPGVD
jgi:hypothetical protein